MNFLQRIERAVRIAREIQSKHLPGGYEEIAEANAKAARTRTVDTRKTSRDTEKSK